MRANETSEQIAVVNYCDYLGIPVVHIANEGKRSVSYGRTLKAMGMRKGFPDLFVPRSRGQYHGLAIEMKYGKGKVSEDQKEWLELLSKEGYATCVCYGADEAIKIIEQYNKLG